MGVEPTLFGPYMWATLHFVAMGAPATFDEKQKVLYKAFYSQLPSIIPCQSCGQHLVETMNNIPIEPALTGALALFEWTVNIHNAVNERLGKPKLSVEEARARLLKSDCTKSIRKNNYYNYGLITLVCILFGVLGMYMYLYFSISRTKSYKRL